MRRKGNRYNGGRTHENGKGRVWSQVEHGAQEEELAPPAATPLMQAEASPLVAAQTVRLGKDREGKATLTEWYNRPDHEMSYFIGDGDADSEEAERRTTVDLSVAVRGLCSEYFECHVSPLLRSLQNTTEQHQLRLQELQDLVGKDLRETVAVEVARRNEQNAVSTLVRLQEISASLQRKADSGSVPTLAQWKALSSKIDQKAVVDQEARDQLRAAETRLTSELAKTDSMQQTLQEKVATLQRDLQQHAEALRAELARSSEAELRKKVQAGDSEVATSELQKVKALVAAAGANFNKQIKELRQQVKALREEGVASLSGTGGLDDRGWPQREPPSPRSDAGSERLSEVGSVAASLAGSVVAGMAPEEKAELKKMQVVVSAAGTAFSKEIRDMKRHLREVGTEDDLHAKGDAG